MNTRKIILIILGIAVVLVLVSIVVKTESQTTIQQVKTEDLINQLCFYNESATERGFGDVVSIKMNIEKDLAWGEVKYLPAEKDSKVGTFEGLVVETNSEIGERTAVVWWDSFAEGMQVKEELLIKMIKDDDGSINSARMGFGEMVDRGDGAYAYKDKENLSYIDIPRADCATLQ